jgi:hypothetical protein
MELEVYSNKRKVIGLIVTFIFFVVIMYVELYDPDTSIGAVWGVSSISSVLYFVFYLLFTSPKGTKIAWMQGVMVPNRTIKLHHFVTFSVIYIVYLIIGYGFRWLAS